jgi:hypothetical protein
MQIVNPMESAMLSEAVQLEIARQMPIILSVLVTGIMTWRKLTNLTHQMNSGLEALEKNRLAASDRLIRETVKSEGFEAAEIIDRLRLEISELRARLQTRSEAPPPPV